MLTSPVFSMARAAIWALLYMATPTVFIRASSPNLVAKRLRNVLLLGLSSDMK